MSWHHACPEGHTWSVRVQAGEKVPCCPRCGIPAVPVEASEEQSTNVLRRVAPAIRPSSLLLSPGQSGRVVAVEGNPGGARGRLPVVPGYDILEILGHGGMGVVYRARQRSLDRMVALKMIRENHLASDEGLLRFRSEALAVARLNHPNIIQIHEVGEYGGTPYISLELVEGGTLDDWTGDQQPCREAAGLIERVARAVHAAHACGLVHRDLKPANLLLDWPEGVRTGLRAATPKVADFGLAKQIGTSDGPTVTGQVVGTPSYMAPEQANPAAGAVGPWTDVYAIGAILYELLTGSPPFLAPTSMETLRLVQEREPTSPRKVRREIPRDLETIVLKCLAKDPRHRYLSAEALAADLNRFQAGHPIEARPVGRVVHWARRVRRNPVVAALVAVLLLILLGLSLTGILLGQQRDQARQAVLATVRDLLHESEKFEERALESKQPAHFDKALQHIDRADDHLRSVRDPLLLRETQEARTRLEQARDQAQRTIDEKRNEDEFIRQLETMRSERLCLEMDGRLSPARPNVLRQVMVANGIPFGQGTPDAVVEAVRRRPRLQRAILDALVEGVVMGDSSKQARELVAIVGPLESNKEGVRILEWLETDPGELLDPAKQMLLERLPVSYTLVTGIGLLSRKHYDAAVGVLRQGIVREPNNFWLHYYLGTVSQVRIPSNNRAAVSAYRSALALRPGSGHTLSNLAGCLLVEGEAEEAIIYLRRACTLQPGFASYHHNLGHVFLRIGKTEEARKLFERALAINPQYPLPMVELSLLELEAGRFEESANWVRKAMPLVKHDGRLRAETQVRLQTIQRYQSEKGLLDQVLRGEKELNSVADASALIEQCYFRGKHLDAYQLSKRAFARYPGMEADRKGAWYRFNAACYAALASNGQGIAASRLTTQDRVAIRREALTWLESELKELKRRGTTGQARERREVSEALGEWLTDATLTSVRAKAQLDRLTDAERREWQLLWANVEALRSQLQ